MVGGKEGKSNWFWRFEKVIGYLLFDLIDSYTTLQRELLIIS